MKSFEIDNYIKTWVYYDLFYSNDINSAPGGEKVNELIGKIKEYFSKKENRLNKLYNSLFPFELILDLYEHEEVFELFRDRYIKYNEDEEKENHDIVRIHLLHFYYRMRMLRIKIIKT